MLSSFTYDAFAIRKRRRLPHWHAPEGLYFVTFRLADSLPAWVLRDLPPQRAAIERALDRGYGDAILRHKAVDVVRSALEHFDGHRYSLICWTIMPNHVHVVFRLLGDHRLDRVMSSLKRHTSRNINELLNRRSTLWQEEYFDTLIRSPAHLERATLYVLGNPAKAGLEDIERVGFDREAYGELIGMRGGL